jgi:hypothetical protein
VSWGKPRTSASRILVVDPNIVEEALTVSTTQHALSHGGARANARVRLKVLKPVFEASCVGDLISLCDPYARALMDRVEHFEHRGNRLHHDVGERLVSERTHQSVALLLEVSEGLPSRTGTRAQKPPQDAREGRCLCPDYPAWFYLRPDLPCFSDLQGVALVDPLPSKLTRS